MPAGVPLANPWDTETGDHMNYRIAINRKNYTEWYWEVWKETKQVIASIETHRPNSTSKKALFQALVFIAIYHDTENAFNIEVTINRTIIV